MLNSKSRRIVEGSCWACRKRRVKCSLDKPSCIRCERSGSDCEYGTKLQWVGGPAARGRYAPASPTSPPNAATFQDTHLTLSASLSTPDLDSQSLVLYFSNAVIPRFQLAGSSILIDEGAIIRDPTLRPAVLAVSKAHHHFCSRSPIDKGRHSSEQARQLALTSFRHRLESGVSCAPTAQDLLQVVILFCMLDGVIFPETESNASVQHLKGGYSLLDSWASIVPNMVIAGGLQAHLVSIFVTMDLVHALLAGERPYFTPTTWLMFGEVDAWWGRLACGDRFLTLLKGFSEMASLGHFVKSHLPENSATQLAQKCIPSIEMMLAGPTGMETSPTFASAAEWDAFCSIYEIAATIYSHRTLRGRSVSHEAVQSATRRGISKLMDDQLPGMLAHCVVFPLLVIGSHCIHTQDRKAASEFLSPSTSYLSFGSLVLMTDLLQEIWSQSNVDSTWWEMFEPVSSKTFLF
ncbi:hypothetical protein M409DRAFT_66864 [Zasmidium cellare ATCC 36951]|uniref:Zn(2)-C6 fungal-type domain-containing protein n=1 Tax=Zasmidium cellare ATCC 36951 TaxID=1080233 RepID=A0A6A6CIA2_ZASCE|nr:uncharacterized protein M409DRAFT_66864 [Zasmidium cellare ATCC 36951]KAF2165908.1 hypothetical protein M409DRAFT_66864 [Zasmidium cellare ATCC 36951]